MTLNTMGVAERRNWSRRVQQQMDERMPDASRIVVLAVQRYREFLMDYLAGGPPRCMSPWQACGTGRS